ncbi:MAG: AAA family ATPase [Proteobacteria bacterium]|nr:AAA family ATPase [Pseudomonadota bacterium]
MAKFIGRKRELEILHGLTQKKTASLIVIKGRRRIGKSRLIKEFGETHKPYYIFSGLPPTPQTTKQSQINEFVRQLREYFRLPNIRFSDWGDVFYFLADKVKTGKVIVVFDEISWIGSKDSDFLGKLKNAWDLHFKENDNLILILCGSVSSWIEKNILNSTGFVGRTSAPITIGELSLSECNEFFGSKGKLISAYEKFKILAITGGIPKYLEEIRPELTADQNIKNLCFIKEGFLFNEFDQMFSDLFLSKSSFYKKALELLVNGNIEGTTLCKAIKFTQNNTTSDYLYELMQAGFISRDYTWNLATQTEAKLSHYRLKDNYTRFYLKYILPNKNRISDGAFESKALSSLPNWNTIMGLQFENLVLNNRKRIQELLQISPDEIIWDNPFFQNKTSKQPGCQIDYLINTKFSNLYLCEIKFSQSEIKKDIIEEMEQKIKNLQKPKGFSCRPILIHVNGVHEEVKELDYFFHIIDFSDLLKK